MTLQEVENLVAKETDPTRLRQIADALLRHIYEMDRSFRVVELEARIGQSGDIDLRGPSDWPGDW